MTKKLPRGHRFSSRSTFKFLQLPSLFQGSWKSRESCDLWGDQKGNVAVVTLIYLLIFSPCFLLLMGCGCLALHPLFISPPKIRTCPVRHQ